jgi:integrase
MVYKHPNQQRREIRDRFNKLLYDENFIQLFETSEKIKIFLQYDIQRPSTRKSYRRALKIFFCEQKITNIDRFVLNPEALSNGKKIAYKDDLEQRIKRHNEFITNTLDYEGNTVNVHLSAIQSFIESNKIELGDRFWTKLKENGKGTSRVTDTKTPDLITLRQILKEGDTETQAAFLVQLSTGARIDQILTLEWSNIQQINNEFPLVIYYPDKNKTKRLIKTFLTPEAKETLLQYQKQRESIINTREKRGNHLRKNEFDTNKIFPMTVNNLEKKWRNMCKKAGHYIPDNRTGRPAYGTHCIRRYYLDNFGDRELAKLFCGKGKKADEAYFRKSDNELRNLYAQHADNITVLKETSENTLLTKNLKTELDEWKEKYQKLEEKQKGQNEIITKSNLATKQRLDQLERIVMAKTRDEINPISPLPSLIRKDPKELTPEQQKEREEWIKQYNERRRILLQDQEVEEQYEKRAIQEKLQELKHMQETEPLAKDAEIVFFEGVPFLHKENLEKDIKKLYPGVKLKKAPTPKGTTIISIKEIKDYLENFDPVEFKKDQERFQKLWDEISNKYRPNKNTSKKNMKNKR